MKTSKQLKEERKVKRDAAEALLNTAEAENKEFTAEEQTQFDNLTNEIEQLSAQIEAAEKRENFKRSSAKPIDAGLNSEEKEKRNFSLSKLVMEARDNDTSSVTGLEKELLDESAKEAREKGLKPSGIYLSDDILSSIYDREQRKKEQRTMTVGTNSAGGFFVPTQKLGFFDALYAMTFLEKTAAVKLTGLSANTDLPGFSVAVTSAWAAETGTQSPADATVVNRTLRPKLLYSACDISKQLIIQTNDSIDAYILNSMMQSMAREFEKQVINGDGSNKPTGILGTSGIGSVAVGTNGGAITFANVLKLIQVVESANANIANAQFLTNPKVKAAMKQIPIDSGSGAMIMSYQNYFGGNGGGTVDGYETMITSNVPSTLDKGTSTGACSALIFGDFSQLVTAQFGGVDLMIDNVSAAIVRTGKVAITINQFVDSALKQPAAIGAIQDIIA